MRNCAIYVFLLLLLAGFVHAQAHPASPTKAGRGEQSARAQAQPGMKDVLAAKVKTEWEALKKKDKQAYSDLLAEDFVGVEDDGQGTRNKLKAVNEVERGNVYNYSLFAFSVIPLGPNAALAIYESTMEFFPGAQVRVRRVYVSELWLKRDGQWKARHYQETHVR